MYFYEFPYALILFDKDISKYSRTNALCSEQLAQLFRVYTGYMGSQITWSTYNFDLTTQNLKGSKIYWNLHFCTFCSVKNCKSEDFDRFCYRLGSEWLNKDATNDKIGHTYHWSFHVYTDIM